MKRAMLAITAITGLGLPVLAPAAAPEFYGRIDLSLEQNRLNDEATPANNNDTWALENNASRLGVKGSFDLDVGDLEAFYKAEFEIHPDDGREASGGGIDQVIDQRDIYGGIRGRFGAIQTGYFDSPLKDAHLGVEQFDNLDGDIKVLMAGENRYENQVMYSTPALLEMVTVNLSAIQQEGADIDGDGRNEEEIGESLSGSIVVEHRGFYAALAADRDSTDSLEVDAELGPIDIDRFTAGFKGDRFEAGAIYQIASDTASGSDAEDSSWLVSAAWKLDRFKLKAQGGITEGEVSKDERRLAVLGVDYRLNKQSKLFSYYADNRLKADAPDSDVDSSTLGVGFQHKF